MQTQHKKLQTHEKELFLRSCVVAECHTTSKNILNKEIREYVVVHMRVAGITRPSEKEFPSPNGLLNSALVNAKTIHRIV
jgi:hypothetical protein